MKTGTAVKFTHLNLSTNEEQDQYGMVVEVVPAGTDDPEAPERACVAWVTGGVSGPIDTSELKTV